MAQVDTLQSQLREAREEAKELRKAQSEAHKQRHDMWSEQMGQQGRLGEAEAEIQRSRAAASAAIEAKHVAERAAKSADARAATSSQALAEERAARQQFEQWSNAQHANMLRRVSELEGQLSAALATASSSRRSGKDRSTRVRKLGEQAATVLDARPQTAALFSGTLVHGPWYHCPWPPRLT